MLDYLSYEEFVLLGDDVPKWKLAHSDNINSSETLQKESKCNDEVKIANVDESAAISAALAAYEKMKTVSREFHATQAATRGAVGGGEIVPEESVSVKKVDPRMEQFLIEQEQKDAFYRDVTLGQVGGDSSVSDVTVIPTEVLPALQQNPNDMRIVVEKMPVAMPSHSAYNPSIPFIDPNIEYVPRHDATNPGPPTPREPIHELYHRHSGMRDVQMLGSESASVGGNSNAAGFMHQGPHQMTSSWNSQFDPTRQSTDVDTDNQNPSTGGGVMTSSHLPSSHGLTTMNHVLDNHGMTIPTFINTSTRNHISFVTLDNTEVDNILIAEVNRFRDINGMNDLQMHTPLTSNLLSGRIGEHIAYLCLKRKFQEICTNIVWMNQENEKGQPYDIVLVFPGNLMKGCEVKTRTISLINRNIPNITQWFISPNEISFAIESDTNYFCVLITLFIDPRTNHAIAHEAYIVGLDVGLVNSIRNQDISLLLQMNSAAKFPATDA